MNLTIRNSIILCVYISLRHLFHNLQGLLTNQRTLIYKNFFNSFEFTTLSGTITRSISDHLIQFVILEDFITPKLLPKTNLYKRNFDNFDNNKLKEHLRKIDWINEIWKNGNDINEIFETFYKTLNEIVDRHAPLAKVTKKERTLQSKPWINKEIKHFMWKRDKLFRKFCAYKNETQKKLIHEEFKKSRNNVTFSINVRMNTSNCFLIKMVITPP